MFTISLSKLKKKMLKRQLLYSNVSQIFINRMKITLHWASAKIRGQHSKAQLNGILHLSPRRPRPFACNTRCQARWLGLKLQSQVQPGTYSPARMFLRLVGCGVLLRGMRTPVQFNYMTHSWPWVSVKWRFLHWLHFELLKSPTEPFIRILSIKMICLNNFDLIIRITVLILKI